MTENIYEDFIPFSSDDIMDVRNGLSDADFSIIDDSLILDSLKDAIDFFSLIVDETAIPHRAVRRCLIRYATYIAYQRYTALSERKLGTMPESAALQLQTLLLQSYNCLSLISNVPLNPDLSVDMSILDVEPYGTMSTSMVERAIPLPREYTYGERYR